jgi:hypothetical protein
MCSGEGIPVAESADMEVRSVEAIIRALNEANVRYLVAGGVAVVAHGHVRYTADIDLILDLAEDNVKRALTALAGLEYRPLVPVAMEQFADPAVRSGWVQEKGMMVFSLVSPQHQATAVDIFVEAPLEFARAYGEAVRFEVAPGLPATVVSLADLLALKAQAARAKDMLDIEYLKRAQERRKNG